MIKLILFDLDGVLVSAKDIHYSALNQALGLSYAITREEHLGRYDGLTTRNKLAMLTEEKGLPAKDHDDVWRRKQAITLEMFLQGLPVTIRCAICLQA